MGAAGSAANVALGTPGAVTLEVITRNVTTNALVPAANPLTNSPGVGMQTDAEAHEGDYAYPINLPAITTLAPGSTYETVARIFAGARISFAEWMLSN
jgi:hypothetical protein